MAAYDAAYLPLHERLRALFEKDGRSRTPYRFGLGRTLSAALMHYLGRKSCDEVAARNGFLLSTEGIHLSHRTAAVVADLVADWLTAP